MSSSKKIKRKILGYLILALTTIAANHIPPASEAILGKKIYHERCKVCHGNQGDGKTFAANALFPPPKNFTTRASKKDLTRKQMILSVTRGRPSTAMMAWENILSRQEIYSVVDYIRQVLMGLQK
jgi:mono/diheme cytochrome c family protein